MDFLDGRIKVITNCWRIPEKHGLLFRTLLKPKCWLLLSKLKFSALTLTAFIFTILKFIAILFTTVQNLKQIKCASSGERRNKGYSHTKDCHLFIKRNAPPIHSKHKWFSNELHKWKKPDTENYILHGKDKATVIERSAVARGQGKRAAECRGIFRADNALYYACGSDLVMLILFSQDWKDLEYFCQARKRDLWVQDTSVCQLK